MNQDLCGPAMRFGTVLENVSMNQRPGARPGRYYVPKRVVRVIKRNSQRGTCAVPADIRASSFDLRRFRRADRCRA